jgi:chorismate synthase
MAGSTFGNLFKITTWGESHGKGLGVVIDGCPAGLALGEDDIQAFLNRRRPGQSAYTTPRTESDTVSILSGVFEGKTTGTPISLVVYNENQRSKDYGDIANTYRPGHADLTYDAKYGFRDYRGGGRSSGRETIGRVAAGAIAAKILGTLGVTFCTYTKSIGHVVVESFMEDEIIKNPLYMPDATAAKLAQTFLNECMINQDSAGSVVECVISNLPAGLGEPVFDKLDANLAKAIFSIGAVKGFEIGSGMAAAKATGTTHNDELRNDNGNGNVTKLSNNAGGILGGISDGSDIVLRAAFKPTPSIASTQQTVDKNGKEVNIHIEGRHDPVIAPRAVVVVESMAAITLVDALLANMGSRIENLSKIYE